MPVLMTAFAPMPFGQCAAPRCPAHKRPMGPAPSYSGQWQTVPCRRCPEVCDGQHGQWRQLACPDFSCHRYHIERRGA